jgi:uncharacterized damage-inducible protein DinB
MTMYETIAEFVDDWTKESAISLKVQRALTDGSLPTRSDPEGNTLGKIAWHMVVMIGLTGAAMGLEVTAPPRGTEPPATAAGIAEAYQAAARSLAEQAAAKLKDSQLTSEVTYFGRTVRMALVLQSLVRHQIHHRAQMTILMRQAALIVPGVYGPSREETAAMRARAK